MNLSEFIKSIISKWYLVIAILLIIITYVRAHDQVVQQHGTELRHVPSFFDYEKYLAKYQNKFFAFKGNKITFMHSLQLFLARTLKIFKHNVQYATTGGGHYLTQNMFTGMSWRQIERSYMPSKLDDNIELAPVREALAMPDMPAEDFILSKISMPDDTYYDSDESSRPTIDDDYSQASFSSDLLTYSRRVKSKASLDPLIKLKREEQLENLDSLLNDIKLGGGQETNKMAARLSANLEVPMEVKLMVERARLAESARKQRESPIVKSNNPNFDPSLLPSYGLFDSIKKYTSGDSEETDDDYDDEDEEDDNEDEDEAENENRSLLKSMLTKIGSYFTDLDVFDYEEDDDDLINFKRQDEKISFKEKQKDNNNNNNNNKPKIVFDVDWRQTGCVPRPKNQMQCNACYAFATLDLMEFFHCRQKKVYTEFSAQYIVDCGIKHQLNGCQGGKLSNVGRFIQDFGLQLNSNYPYMASQQHCPYDSDDDRNQKSYSLKPAITGWRAFDQIDAWYRWLPKTPVIVGINLPSDFLAYGGGVHNGLDCIPGVAHAMLLVGSGKQDGSPFWLLKNSYSSEWGESGYFRLSKRAPLKCFDSVIVARAKFDVAQ